MPSGNGSNRSGAGSNNKSSSSKSSSGKGNAPSGTSSRYGYTGPGYGGGNSKSVATSKSTSSAYKSTGGGSGTTKSSTPQNIRFTGGVTKVNKGVTLSAADYMKGGYGQYRQAPSVSSAPVKVAKDQSRIAPTSPLQPYMGLQQYVSKNTGPANPVARAMTGPKVAMGPGSNYKFGDLAMGQLRQPKQFTASLGDDMATGIESRVASRVATPSPLRGVSTQGRAPMVSPMAGQGSPYPGPTSPVAGKAGFPAYQARLQSTLMDNYNRGQSPSIQMAANPSPTSAQPQMSSPQRASLIGDDPDSFVSPNTLGRGAGGLIGTIVGGPVGGLLGSKLGGYAVDKAREYGHPLYGSGGGGYNPDQERLSGTGTGGSSWPNIIDPMTNQPTMANSAVQTTPQPQQPKAFRPKQSMYPEYYSTWAGLPAGLFG